MAASSGESISSTDVLKVRCLEHRVETLAQKVSWRDIPEPWPSFSNRNTAQLMGVWEAEEAMALGAKAVRARTEGQAH